MRGNDEHADHCEIRDSLEIGKLKLEIGIRRILMMGAVASALDKESSVTRTGVIARSVLGIIGFAFLLLCGAYAAILGLAVSEGGPHAFKGDARIGLIFGLIAVALIVASILLLRGSIRRLRSLRHPPLV